MPTHSKDKRKEMAIVILLKKKKKKKGLNYRQGHTKSRNKGDFDYDASDYHRNGRKHPAFEGA